MSFKFTDISVENNDFEPGESDKIHPCLLKNNRNEVIKSLEFLSSNEKLLYIHGFLGTGKKQFVNYICEHLAKDVITLEYYCKEATVCDDILLYFSDILETTTAPKTVKLNAKITTLTVKFQKMLETIKRPVLVILHSLDNVSSENLEIITETLSKILKEENVKIVVTTCALKTGLMGDIEEDRTIFLKAFTKEIFKEYVVGNNINASDKQIEDFYALTRGYYFYTALSLKVMQALNISLVEFLQKLKSADTTFDNYIGELYISLVPVAIRNFFWFLRAIRHGISLNALAILEIYDEFSIQYLKTNLIAFQVEDILYLHDYFGRRIDIMLPANTEIKLHKYIIGIYEQQLKETIANRAILISRQAMRSEIEYHKSRISYIENNGESTENKLPIKEAECQSNLNDISVDESSVSASIPSLIEEAQKLADDDKPTEAIEKFKMILENNEINLTTLVDVRLKVAKLYSSVGEYSNAMHYYELVEAYYKNNKEFINLNYLYYEMSDLFYKMYKPERAIETINKVIYSVDTPRSLMVSACTFLGNIYSDMNNPDKAFSYYQKALDSLDENVDDEILSEIYFKFALANDDKGNLPLAFEYYNRCISISGNNKYLAPAYSNLASCYYENENRDDALDCFMKAYNIEKTLNNYDGIYYTASHIAQILNEQGSKNTLKYLTEAKQSAEFVNEPFYMVEAFTALGDYYYNIPGKAKEALSEYYKAIGTANDFSEPIDVSNLMKRIDDMKLRMPEQEFLEIQNKYEK